MKSFFPFDRVSYHGTKFNELRTKMGEVVHVVPENGAVVVDFGESDAYVVSPKSLKTWIPPKDKDGNEIEVQVVRRKKRKTEEDEG